MRIAVIIPTQWKRATITETLQSVYDQTRNPDELIIVGGNNQAAQMNHAISMSTCDAYLYIAENS